MKNIFIFFGPPGSGKGTQAEMLSKKLSIPAVSSGNLFRQEIKRKTKIGEKVKAILAGGKLVPEKMVEEIINKRIRAKDTGKGFILDGYPRNKKQLGSLIKRLDKIVAVKDKELAILVEVGDKEVKSRLGGRRVCACGATYHLKYNPPKKKGICDLCGAKLRVREDDKAAVIAKRLKIYRKESAPVLKYYRRKKKLIAINGEQSIKEVHEDTLKKLVGYDNNKK